MRLIVLEYLGGQAPLLRGGLFYALCNGRELSINLQCQANKKNALVPGIVTRVKQRGAAAGYNISEEAI